ncbi:hypothetical protein L195_g011600 [Trifolium pratense]|uniref:Uncharacterized protein n=1 Tax=Trifolium pratense TaxID=57577 RepID=A0A2K3PI06_TRIPR|nr:hypothetical protein L195_g011600 [Trifolium pratense]
MEELVLQQTGQITGGIRVCCGTGGCGGVRANCCMSRVLL